MGVKDALAEKTESKGAVKLTKSMSIADMIKAKNTLAGDGLPQELAAVLNYADADTCKKSMEAVKEAFQKAVETAVEEKLKGGKPPKKASGTDDQKAQQEAVYNAMMGKF